MKKGIFTLAAVLALALSAGGQLRPSTVFLELLGNGSVASLNYDRRFSKTNSGFGGRIGIGLGAIPGSSWFGDYIPTFPLAVNYLTGEGPHHVEASLGITFANEKFGASGG